MSGLYFANADNLGAALNRVLGLHELGTGLIAEQVFEQELASPSATCTCPSGDGSLRWPCPVHLPDSWSVHIDEYDDGTGRAIIAGPRCYHMELPISGSMLDFMKAISAPTELNSSVSVTSSVEQRAERAAKAVVQWLYEGMDGATVNLMDINVEAIILSVLRGEE